MANKKKTNGKDTAVLFYSQDWLVGTLTMSYEERGKYITLLCMQHQKGKLTMKDLKAVLTEEDVDNWLNEMTEPTPAELDENLAKNIELQKNPIENSKIATGVPGNVKIAFKTGGMGGVSTEWAIVYLKNRPYAITVMENYKTSATPSTLISSISKRVFDYYSMMKATKYGVLLEN